MGEDAGLSHGVLRISDWMPGLKTPDKDDKRPVTQELRRSKEDEYEQTGSNGAL